MLVTKNVAELCVLLINELYGQLPSRIFADLLARGRSTVPQLAHHTSLNPRQVRHGIAVLIQLNLIFHYTNQDTGVTFYDPNPHVAYSLVRIGKILDMVRIKYGQLAHELVRKVLLEGHAKISFLVEALRNDHVAHHDTVDDTSDDGYNHVNGNGNGNGNGLSNGTNGAKMANGDFDIDLRPYDSLVELIKAGILEPVMPTAYQSPEDQRYTVEQEFLVDYPTGIRGSKQTIEFEKRVRDKLREMQGQSKKLKRKLEDESPNHGPKRRKVTNGDTSNGVAEERARSLLHGELDTVVRVNYEKCTVELRNLKLEQYAEDLIGSTTAQVYGTLLSVLSAKISRCQVDKSIEDEEENGDSHIGLYVTTQEVFEHLSASIDVSAGIGFPRNDDQLDSQLAEKIQRYPPPLIGSTLELSLEEGEELVLENEDYDRSGEGVTSFGFRGQNGSDGSKANGGVSLGMQRLHQMRQHLLVLAGSKQGFVRHCGGRGYGEWTVDFEPLLQHLKFVELDTIIENRFGRQGLRLIRILREKGKLDDKTLPSLALMKRGDVQAKMVDMEMAGFLDVQEVPRDANRSANRSLFLWFFDLSKTLQRLLDNTCKSMVRCLQRLDVERKKKKTVLGLVERKDVQGQEKEMLRGDLYNEYVQFLDIEKKLLGQVERLDDVVAVFRDY